MISAVDKKYFRLAVGTENIGRETDVDIPARCPVCGDSRTHKRKKRLHLYIKNGVTNIHCFNGSCAVESKTVYSFLRDFYPALLPQYKRETFGNTLEKLAQGDVFEQFKEPKIEKESPVLTQDLSMYFKDIKDVPECLQFLKKRGLEYNEEKYGKFYYGYQDLKIGDTNYNITNSIIIPLYYKNQMYGFYSRNILNKIFCTYMNSTNIGFKIWHWFNIKKEEPVYIYEGIFDAISGGLKNSIALMGAKIPEERLQELKYPVFILDNDRTGLYNSLSYAKKAHVYIQPEEYLEKDMNELFLNHKDLNIQDMIKSNLYSGISAEIRIKNKM